MVTREAPAFFKARVDMVSVPVVVRDGKGHAIGTYTKENFQVFDKGKLQDIVRFVVEKSGDQAARAAKTVDTALTDVDPSAGAKAPASDIPERFVAYLFDDMHLEWADLTRARIAAGRQLSQLAKTDRAAIYTTSVLIVVFFTDYIDKLQANLLLLRNRSLSSKGGVKQCPDISYYMADLILKSSPTTTDLASPLNVAAQETMACFPDQKMDLNTAQLYVQGVASQVHGVGSQETHVSLTVFKDVVRRMAGMPGQRIVVLVSPGFISPTEYQPDKNEILDRAIKANVVINGLNARGLWTDPEDEASQHTSLGLPFQIQKNMYDRESARVQGDVLAEMAYGTGGALFQNNNDLDQGMRELAGAPEYYYVIGFSPQNLKNDGSFHALKVTLKTNPMVGLNIQARKGYYAPKKASTAEETAKDEIAEALFSSEELSDLPVELHAQYFKASEKDATIAVICKMDAKRIQFRKAEGRNINSITVLTAVFDRNGNLISAIQKIVDFKMKDETLAKLLNTGVMTLKTNVPVAPGTYKIRLVVRDSEGQLMSALNSAVAIQ